MIEIGLNTLVAGVLGATMLGVALFAWISRWHHIKTEKRSLHRRAVCRLCLATFEADGRGRVHHCPHCGADTGAEGPTPLG